MADTRDDLPDWAREALSSMKRKLKRGEVKAERGCVWRSPDGRLSVWSRTGSHNASTSCLVAFAFPVGLALMIGAVIALRYDYVLWWLGLPGAVLSAIGIAGFTYSKSYDLRPGPNVILLDTEGLVRIEGKRYEALPRSAVGDVGVVDGALKVSSRFGGEYVLTHMSRGKAIPSEWLTENAQRVQDWVKDGILPDGGSGGMAIPAHNSTFWVTSLSGVAAFFVGLTYLTVVMPQNSDAGQAVLGFIDDVSEDRTALAYQRMTRGYRDKHDLAAFAASLPPGFKGAYGFSINGLASATAFDGHRAICVDGHLRDVSHEFRYAFALRQEDDAPRIWGWRKGKCDKQTWWRSAKGGTE